MRSKGFPELPTQDRPAGHKSGTRGGTGNSMFPVEVFDPAYRQRWRPAVRQPGIGGTSIDRQNEYVAARNRFAGPRDDHVLIGPGPEYQEKQP